MTIPYITFDKHFRDKLVDDGWDPVYYRALTLRNGFVDINFDTEDGLWTYNIEYMSRWEWDDLKTSGHIYDDIGVAYFNAVRDFNADIKRMGKIVSRCDRIYQKHHFWEMLIGLPDQPTLEEYDKLNCQMICNCE